MESFCHILKEERLRKGLTQAQLGNELGLSNTAISSYESGRKIPSIVTIIHLANYFNLSMDYLLGVCDFNFYGIQKEEVELARFLMNHPNILSAVIPFKHNSSVKKN